ncbi:hypothetical protein ABIF90_002227 [Bradyrhizobium japonicum]
MREQHPSNDVGSGRSGSHRFTLIQPAVALTAGMLWLVPAATSAQTTMPGMQPSTGMLATSPLNPQSTRPVGVPLGSTEIVTPGISPLNPAQSTAGCAGSGNTASSGALFDGGGLSGGSSVTCNGSITAASPLPSASTVGRVGIPLGATELGGAGISPSVPVQGPAATGSTTSISGSSNP